MQVYVTVKQPGKKHAFIDRKAINISEPVMASTAGELISAIVRQQVEEFNSKPREKNLLPFLSKEETDEKIQGGKIGFGSIYNEKIADVDAAISTAHQAFEDGMYALFVDDLEIESLSTPVSITNQTQLTFIRLSFLAGSYW